MPFEFKQFAVQDQGCAMKVGTDGILLGAWFRGDQEVRRVLDVGTGSGLIALMLTQRFLNWQLTGIEIDSDAAKAADWNRQKSPWANRIRVVAESLQQHAGTGQVYDAVVCNPPFFSAGMMSDVVARRNARHQACMTPRDFFAGCRRLSHEQTWVGLIVPAKDRAMWENVGWEYQFQVSRRTDVIPLPGRPVKRCLLEFRASPCPAPQVEYLMLEREHHLRTEEFQALTQDFYLR